MASIGAEGFTVVLTILFVNNVCLNPTRSSVLEDEPIDLCFGCLQPHLTSAKFLGFNRVERHLYSLCTV
jgi:hypothetical protein